MSSSSFGARTTMQVTSEDASPSRDTLSVTITAFRPSYSLSRSIALRILKTLRLMRRCHRQLILISTVLSSYVDIKLNICSNISSGNVSMMSAPSSYNFVSFQAAAVLVIAALLRGLHVIDFH